MYAPAPTSEAKDDENETECCGVFFLKMLLYIFNFILLVSGVVIFAVGVWTLVTKNSYVALLTSGFYEAATYILLVTGIVIVLVVFVLGCVGAWLEHQISLGVYIVLLILVFLLEAISGIIAAAYNNMLLDELTRSLNETMLLNYNRDELMTSAIDDMQRSFRCCGAGSFRDWSYSVWLLGTPTSLTSAPDSCCKTETRGCAVRTHPSNIHYNGCVTSLEHYVTDHLFILSAVGFGFCFLQVLGIVLACCLVKRIHDSRDRQYSR